MPPGVLRVMAEMYAHGDVVRDTAGRQFVHWPWSMRQLPNVPVSTISRVLPMLLEEELLVEHPGTRMAASRLWSTFSAPVEEPVARVARLQDLRFPFPYSANPPMEHAPEAAAESEEGGASSHAVEHAHDFLTSRSESTEGAAPMAVESGHDGWHVPRADKKYSPVEHAPGGAQTRAHVRGPEHHQQQGHARSSSNTHVPSADSASHGLSSLQPSTPDGSQDEIAELCLAALKVISVGRPENVMRQFPLNSVAAALEQLVMKLSRGEEVSGKGAAYVMWLLVNRLDFAPVEDFGFLRYFVPAEDPKVVSFALRRSR